jgi:hypothetical protein
MRKNAKMHENAKMRKNAKMCENAKMHKNAKMRDETQRCATMQTKRKCGKVSWVHDGDVVL